LQQVCATPLGARHKQQFSDDLPKRPSATLLEWPSCLPQSSPKAISALYDSFTAFSSGIEAMRNKPGSS
jgi:hypothetical protein